MIDSVTPTWDGNETWLVMTGITLFTAFPVAYGILMPAFYLPIIVMLLSLGLRGVSFEFRVQMKKSQRRWDKVFGVASLIAAFMQGLILGGLLQGVKVEGVWFAGSIFDVDRALPLITGVTVVVGYSGLGAGWLILKANNAVQQFARTVLRWAPFVFVVMFCIAYAYAVSIQPEIRLAWTQHVGALSVITSVLVLSGSILSMALLSRSKWLPLILGLSMLLSGMIGFALVVFPMVIPFRMSLWDAASSSSSQRFLLVGATIVTPVILAYSAFAYWVFRGPTPSKGWKQGT